MAAPLVLQLGQQLVYLLHWDLSQQLGPELDLLLVHLILLNRLFKKVIILNTWILFLKLNQNNKALV